MNILILKSFNNYTNRIALRYDSLDNYKSASEAFFNFSAVNFNPGNGITTELVVGNENQQMASGQTTVPLDWEFSGNPDYLVCFDTVGGVSTIKSR